VEALMGYIILYIPNSGEHAVGPMDESFATRWLEIYRFGPQPANRKERTSSAYPGYTAFFSENLPQDFNGRVLQDNPGTV
jgi:hypothetical protein